MVDLAGEDFHEEQVPRLGGADRQTVIQRRLAHRYRDTRLAAAVSLGQTTGERRNERLLLTSFTNADQILPWLDALTEAGAKLAGVFSVPLIAPALAARLGARSGRCFLVTANRAGLRQVYMDEGRLRFARLELANDLAPEALALFARSETLRLAQYLSTLRVLPRDGPPVQVVVVAPAGQREVFERTLVSDARLAFLTVDAGDALKAVGLRAMPDEALSEALYLQMAVRKPPKEQFASGEDRRAFVLWQLQRAVAGVGAAGFLGCALYAGATWLEAEGIRDLTAIQMQSARAASARYESITRTFPVTQTSTDNLRATVDEFTRMAKKTASPEIALAHVSRVLAEFPEFELDQITWSVGKLDAASTTRKPAATSTSVPAPEAAPGAGSKKPAVPTNLGELIEIAGRVNAARRSDYRAITREVERFADALRSDPAYHISRTKLPFDVSSDGTLTGDIGDSEGGEAPRFTIVLARRLP
ncbi:MAG: hypothetical protein O2975_00160 [Proteobacteria bacterium]|nr:hypothetical protein [Pseudomonadota bacterium]